MYLPQIPYNVSKTKSEIMAMRGINWSDRIQDGDLRDAKNLSARRYPYIATRRGRKQLETYENATALTAWGKLVAVQGTDLLYDGEVVGQVSEGEKQFAVVNTKMVIFPDKVYLDIGTKEIKPLGASISGKGATFTTNTVKVTWGDLTKKFSVGDSINIKGTTKNDKDVAIKALTKDTITVSANAFTAETAAGEVTIERKIPDLDYICESENRLWGCSSKEQTIYASALGDPTNFFVYEGLATDSYALAVGTEGDFTGCVKLTSSVLFWKETKLHKMLGGYPAEYSLYTYDIEGLQKGCHKSMQVINEVLYYMGIHGVYAYSGGTPSLISANFGAQTVSDGVAGNDGDSYYLSMKAGNRHHLMVYEIENGIWVREDDTKALDFTRIGKDLYFLSSDGKVWLADSGEDDKDMEWLAQFAPFYESVNGRKTYSRLLLRVEIHKGSYITVETRADGGVWKPFGRIVGNETDVKMFRLPLMRCDKMELRLSGKGPATILSVMREFSVGSDV